MSTQPIICIYGAGSIGCYVGGRLDAAGASVVMIGRARIGEELAAHGLHLTDYRGAAIDVKTGAFEYSTDATQLSSADLILVTVKSAATAAAGADILRFARADAIVISLQNGIGNDAVLCAAAPQCRVLAGMVQFNVAAYGEGRFHQGSQGNLEVAADAGLAPFLAAFERAGLPLAQHADIVSVQWAKLLLNLNNAVNALSGLPLKSQLAQRAYRRCTALAQEEGCARSPRRRFVPRGSPRFRRHGFRACCDCRTRYSVASPPECSRSTRSRVRPCRMISVPVA